MLYSRSLTLVANVLVFIPSPQQSVSSNLGKCVLKEKNIAAMRSTEITTTNNSNLKYLNFKQQTTSYHELLKLKSYSKH